MKSIESAKDMSHAVEHLIRLEPRFRAILTVHGLPPLRRMPHGLESLLRIITDQLISLSAAEAIWRRLEARLTPFTADMIIGCEEPELRQLGLTGAKARAFRATADAASDGLLDPDRLDNLDDQNVRTRLTQVKGIGPWTAEIYLLSALGRINAWPAGDIALRTAAAAHFELSERPNSREMERLAECWQPWRSIAARLLWCHYRTIKGMPP